MKISPLTTIIKKAQSEGRLARIPFLTAGFPNPHEFWETAIELAENGADILEIGVPFSDPVADGPVVAKASQEALAHGVTVKYILEGLKKRRKSFKNTAVVLMGYANPFVQFGWAAAKKE
ncbi:MAG: tryptophan synthase subunit alpha, partial [Candidatus Adiutrix sp.]